MKDDRDLDKITTLCPEKGSHGKPVSRDVVKSDYICSGLSADEIAKKFKLSITVIERIIKDDKLQELRKSYITQGLAKLRNKQLTQVTDLLDLEHDFKQLRIVQLQESMKDYLAYYSRFGDLKKRHPITGDVLRDDNDIALTIKIPNIAKEIRDLKESITVASGASQILDQLDSMINSGNLIEDNEEPDIIDIDEYSILFDRDVK